MEFSWLKAYSCLEHVHSTLWASPPVKWASKHWKIETFKQLSFYRFPDQETGTQNSSQRCLSTFIQRNPYELFLLPNMLFLPLIILQSSQELQMRYEVNKTNCQASLSKYRLYDYVTLFNWFKCILVICTVSVHRYVVHPCDCIGSAASLFRALCEQPSDRLSDRYNPCFQ